MLHVFQDEIRIKFLMFLLYENLEEDNPKINVHKSSDKLLYPFYHY